MNHMDIFVEQVWHSIRGKKNNFDKLAGDISF